MNWIADFVPGLLTQNRYLTLMLNEHKSPQPDFKIEWKVFLEELKLLAEWTKPAIGSLSST